MAGLGAATARAFAEAGDRVADNSASSLSSAEEALNSPFAYAAAARLSLQRGRLEQTHRQLARAMRCVSTGYLRHPFGSPYAPSSPAQVPT